MQLLSAILAQPYYYNDITISFEALKQAICVLQSDELLTMPRHVYGMCVTQKKVCANPGE
jgi:hypothetical protein